MLQVEVYGDVTNGAVIFYEASAVGAQVHLVNRWVRFWLGGSRMSRGLLSFLPPAWQRV